MASKGKSTIDVEVDTSALNALVELAEKYRDVLKESNALLRANVDITKQAGGAQRDLNRLANEGSKSRRERRKQAQEEDIFPEGKRYRNAQGTFTKRPTWSQPRDTGTGSQFSAGWEKPPVSGSLSDMDRLRWGPGRASTGSGQFKGNWEKAPKPGTLSDLDRLPWGPGNDRTGSGQFKATFEKFAKGNDKWNESFYQMFSTGRMSQNILRNMFSGNLIKMLGIGGTAAALGYAINEGAAVGAQQRLQATGIGGDIGRMKSAQVELARFGPVQPGLEAANRAKSMIGDEFAAYQFMGFSPEEIKNMDPSTMYAQLMIRAQKKLKGYTPQAMGNLFEAQHLGSILPGGIGQATRLIGMSGQETKEAAEAVEANAKYLETTQEQQKALTNLSTTLNLASSEIQTHFINKLADIAPAIDNFIKNQMNKINEGPEAAPGLKPGGIFNSDNWGWGGPILGGKPAAPTTGPRPDGKLRPVPRLHSPLNNPPLESNIQGSGAVEEGNGGVLGGVTRVSIFSPKIAKLNKDVTDTSRSLADFNKQLLKGSQILVGGSGQYLANKFGKGDGTSGGGGAGGGGGGGGGSAPTGYGEEGGPAQVYYSGGMGEAGQPRKLSRGGGGGGGNQGEPDSVVTAGGGSGSFIKKQEGLVLHPYNDVGHTAIGYGHDFTASELAQGYAVGANGEHIPTSGNISKAQADSLFTKDYQDRVGQVSKKLPGFDKLNSNQQEAVMDYYYNTGRFPKGAAENIASGNMSGIAESLRSGINTAKGQVLPVLTRRRAQEASLFNTAPSATGDGKSSSAGATGGAPEANFGIKDSDDVLDHLKSARDKGLITNEQCVSLATASVGIKLGSKQAGAWTSSWRKGESAAEGGLVKGTPIATFAGLHGEQNQDIYAGGTGGRAKVGLDHAAVFESYIRDKAGKITGMNVADQWKGSGGIQNQHPYYFGRGRGEHDAANYSAIDVAGGGHLGGENNPLTQRDAARASSTRVASRSGPHPHIGDMSQYHTNQAIRVHVNNPAGADIATQTAMIGSSQGNFG